MLTARGPVVIDWTNAARGDPELDVAKTWVLLKTGIPPGGPLFRAVAAVLRDHFARRFLAHAGRPSPAAVLHAAELRLVDRNLLDGERDAVVALARAHGSTPH
jgi:aminoglycoside phosphotransferase (APT) family kinase protein